MGNEFGNSLSDKVYIGIMNGVGNSVSAYETIVCSKKFQSFVASLLLFTGESQYDVFGEILKNSIHDVSDCQMTI